MITGLILLQEITVKFSHSFIYRFEKSFIDFIFPIRNFLNLESDLLNKRVLTGGGGSIEGTIR